MQTHETVRIPLKEVDIDIGIVPLIKWLNGFEDVFTLYCCQGDTEHKPYVLFVCFCTKRLQSILDVIQPVLGYPWEETWHINVDHNKPEYPVRYCLRFKNERQLAKLQEALAKQT